MTKCQTQQKIFNAQLELVPEEPGVYLMRDKSGSVLYVGKANSLRQRLRNYFTPNPDVDDRIATMISRIASYDTIVCDNELEALVLEANLIKKHQPRFNILMRDDKEYPYIHVTLQEDFPRVMKAFRVGEDIEEGARYFGPWLGGDIYRALQVLGTIFPLRRCNLDLPREIGKSRPCLNAHIGRCLAPCSGQISKEAYRAMIDEVVLFLEGRTDDLIKRLHSEMLAASDRLDFEGAAALREKWQALARLREQQRVVDLAGGDRDVLALHRNGYEVAIAKLEIRDGRMTGCVHTFAEDSGGEDGTYLASFIREHYRVPSQVPRDVLVSAPLPDGELLTQFLRAKRGRAVTVHTPQRGAKKALVELALKNADRALMRRALSRGSDPHVLEQTLALLGQLLEIERSPVRIEAYDISHHGKGARSGSMIVFKNGKPERSSYRHFSIKSFDGIDDYKALVEVISRRLARFDDESFGLRPDLILVDGGKGHVSAVLPLARGRGVQVGGIVKDDRHRTRGLVLPSGEIIELAVAGSLDSFDFSWGESETDIPFDGENSSLSSMKLSQHMTEQMTSRAEWSPALEERSHETEDRRARRLGLLHLLTSIQDEAHRFALRHNRQARQRKATQYSLEGIAGVGPARRKALLEHFGSSKRISEATLEELKDISGIPHAVAEAVYNHFHEKKDKGIEPR